MKISKSFIAVFILAILGYTHFLGGPYLFFKIIFWIAIFPFVFSTFLLLLVFFKTKKILHTNTQNTEKRETLHVDAIIKE
jgi:uncharacterized membrane protein